MTEQVSFRVGAENDGVRLDIGVSRSVPNLSRTQARMLVDAGHVRVDGAICKPSHRLAEGETVMVSVERAPALSAEAEDIPLEVVYRDADMAVIDKPAGMVVHPAPGHPGGTLANALVSLFPQSKDVGGGERPGIVHRLDKDTSGLMAVALSPAGQMSLQAQIGDRSAERRYLALVAGHVASKEGIIDAPIGRDAQHRKRMAVHGLAAREARTRYRVLATAPNFTLVEAKLDTGRTHQIRVHFAALGHPVVGDLVYGGTPYWGLERHFLHAYRLALHAPSNGERLSFSSALPDDLTAVLNDLDISPPNVSALRPDGEMR